MSDAGFVAGVRHALAGFRLITRPGVRAYVVVPLLINVVLFGLALYGVTLAIDLVVERYLGNVWAWLQGLVEILLTVLAVVLVFFSFSIVANIVASPFNGMLAEAVERHLRPHMGAMTFSWRRLLGDVGRTVVAELRKLLYIGIRALPLLVVSIIPGLNLLAPALWLLFGAWMLCLEYLDCPLGNHRAFFPRVLTEMRARRRLALGFGGAVTLITLIPVVNFVAMPIGVAGATSLYCRHLDDA